MIKCILKKLSSLQYYNIQSKLTPRLMLTLAPHWCHPWIYSHWQSKHSPSIQCPNYLWAPNCSKRAILTKRSFEIQPKYLRFNVCISFRIVSISCLNNNFSSSIFSSIESDKLRCFGPMSSPIFSIIESDMLRCFGTKSISPDLAEPEESRGGSNRSIPSNLPSRIEIYFEGEGTS